MNHLLYFIFLLLPVLSPAQQLADKQFHFSDFEPLYESGGGPLIRFDEGHNNPHTLKGNYAPFGKLLRQDGYRIEAGKGKLYRDYLDSARIFVTVNAMYDVSNWDLPARSAFTNEEVCVLNEWVKSGGSLFLITDHMPCAASVNSIAKSFGFNLFNGFAMRKDKKDEIFSRERGNLYDNVITNGGKTGARVDSIMFWGGSGFLAPKGASIVSSLGDAYEIFLPLKAEEITETTPKISGLGLVNAAFMKYGEGRVFIVSDGAPFTAQLEGVYSHKRGMNHPKASQNAQLLLNIIHWLDGKLE